MKHRPLALHIFIRLLAADVESKISKRTVNFSSIGRYNCRDEAQNDDDKLTERRFCILKLSGRRPPNVGTCR